MNVKYTQEQKELEEGFLSLLVIYIFLFFKVKF